MNSVYRVSFSATIKNGNVLQEKEILKMIVYIQNFSHRLIVCIQKAKQTGKTLNFWNINKAFLWLDVR